MSSGDGIKAVRTTFRVLHALQEIDGYAGVSELAECLDIPVSTVHSHLNTLRDCEYVIKRGKEYNLGYRFLENGGQLRDRTRLYQFAKPKIDQLAAEFGDEVALVVEDHGLAAHVYISKGEESIETDTYIGIRLHIHSAAGGKAILAFEPEERVHEILDRRGLPNHGPNCITTREAFMEELEEIRETGVAFDYQERIEGIRSVAVPLLCDPPEPNAAIVVSGPVSRMNGDRFDETIPESVENITETIRIKLRYA
ncbi:IclR family transcriptional regulator [Haladaptatus caseinilyticus]|uniref:IclR family transcriptional regulator n=1 Tax=Haladaptatus caseinilyticus TaxID=2993314 RepID=UPI00224B481B|nr:IclR family transcriptional regulator [Haladaptatus caseinilyticus]